MPEWDQVMVVMIIIMFSSCISTATGFGAVVLALPLCSLVVNVKIVVPLLSITSVITCAIMISREYKWIHWPELRRILTWAGIAFPLGNIGYHYLPMKTLETILGVFVTGVAVHGLWRLYHRKPRKEWSKAAGRIILICGGIVQGALASGGPLVVTYAQNSIHERRRFRATLFAVWLTLNIIFITSSFLGKTRQPYSALLALYCLPSLAIGIFVGQRLHRGASEKSFQLLVLTILLLSGLSLLIPGW